MKFKWVHPFTPMIGFAFPPPADMALRVTIAAGYLFLVALFLFMWRPWDIEEKSTAGARRLLREQRRAQR